MTNHVFCNWTVSSKAAEAAALAQAIAASGVQVQAVKGFESTEKPRPIRSSRIDPETVLKRKTIIVKPLHSDSYMDKAAVKRRNREALKQEWV